MIISNSVANALATALTEKTMPTTEVVSAFLAEVQKDKDRNSAKKNQRTASIGAVVALLTPYTEPVTIKDFYAEHESALNELGITSSGSLQYLFLHEMSEMLVKNEVKGKPNTYQLIA